MFTQIHISSDPDEEMITWTKYIIMDKRKFVLLHFKKNFEK